MITPVLGMQIFAVVTMLMAVVIAFQAEHIARLLEKVADLRAQVAKMDGDGDGRIGGAFPRKPK